MPHGRCHWYLSGEMGDNPAADTGGVPGDLETAVETLLNAFAGLLDRAMSGLVADAAQDPYLAPTIRQEDQVSDRFAAGNVSQGHSRRAARCYSLSAIMRVGAAALEALLSRSTPQRARWRVQ
jgi:hypothetical protein